MYLIKKKKKSSAKQPTRPAQTRSDQLMAINDQFKPPRNHVKPLETGSVSMKNRF